MRTFLTYQCGPRLFKLVALTVYELYWGQGPPRHKHLGEDGAEDLEGQVEDVHVAVLL